MEIKQQSSKQQDINSQAVSTAVQNSEKAVAVLNPKTFLLNEIFCRFHDEQKPLSLRKATVDNGVEEAAVEQTDIPKITEKSSTLYDPKKDSLNHLELKDNSDDSLDYDDIRYAFNLIQYMSMFNSLTLSPVSSSQPVSSPQRFIPSLPSYDSKDS